MNFIEHLKLAYRNKYLLAIVTVLCLFSSYFFYSLQNKNLLENTLFFSFAIENQKPANSDLSPFDNLQAADQITESIQGWLISPGMVSEINQLSGLSFPLKAQKQEKNNLLLSFTSDNQENATKFSNQIIQSLQKRLNQYAQKSDLKINLAFSDLKTTQKNSSPSLYLLLGLIIGLTVSYCFALLGEMAVQRIRSVQSIMEIFGQMPLDHYSGESDLVKHHQYLTRQINHQLKGPELQILDQTSKKRFALEIISKYTNYEQIKSSHFPQDIEHIKTNKPTLLMVELGHTKLNNLQRIKTLGIDNLQILVIDKLA